MHDLAAYFATESLFEGVPLTILAFIQMFVDTEPCHLSTCNQDTIAATFPPYVHTLPPSPRPLSAAEAAALQGADCGYYPITQDGWLTIQHSVYMAGLKANDRPSGFFERLIEIQLQGTVLHGGLRTNANGPDETLWGFTCAILTLPLLLYSRLSVAALFSHHCCALFCCKC